MSGFEGSFLGDATRINDATRLECGVCWWVYDPSIGDEVWQIAPGTPFSELPDHWRCPNCDTAQEQFMVLAGGTVVEEKPRPERPAGMETIERCVDSLVAAYERVDQRMRALPVHNEALKIEAVGFHRCAEGVIGVVVTPWCMNLTLVRDKKSGRVIEGTKRDVSFPSGDYEFIAGHLDGVGPIEICSLFSPMEDFEDPEVASDVALHAIDGVFTDPQDAQPDPVPATGEGLSRRDFLKGSGLSPR